eukprot:160424-Chlamydomonas_euryale.AAC.1
MNEWVDGGEGGFWKRGRRRWRKGGATKTGRTGKKMWKGEGGYWAIPGKRGERWRRKWGVWEHDGAVGA